MAELRRSGAERIADAFAGHGGSAALMPYLMGGFPSIEESIEVATASVEGGGQLLELGVPFSDPLADGPVIHAAATDALAAGATLDRVLEVCRSVADRVPVVLMAYSNPVLRRGAAEFARDVASAGGSGLIVPDLPHDEAGAVRGACDDAGIALVPLVAPNTTAERLSQIGADARGFVYTVSLAGTTGERTGLPPGLAEIVGRVRSTTTVPVAVGFGVSTAQQAAEVAAIADGVIVGSRLVRAAREGGADAVEQAVRDLAASLRGS